MNLWEAAHKITQIEERTDSAKMEVKSIWPPLSCPIVHQSE